MKNMIRLIKSLCGAMIMLAGVNSAHANLIGYLDADSVRGNAHGTLVWTGGEGGFDFWIGPDEIKLSNVRDGGEFPGEHYMWGSFYFLTPFGNEIMGTGGGGGIFHSGIPSTGVTGDGDTGVIRNKYGDIYYTWEWHVAQIWDGAKFTPSTGTWSLRYNYPAVPDDGTGTAALLGISLAGMGAWARRRARIATVPHPVD